LESYRKMKNYQGAEKKNEVGGEGMEGGGGVKKKHKKRQWAPVSNGHVSTGNARTKGKTSVQNLAQIVFRKKVGKEAPKAVPGEPEARREKGSVVLRMGNCLKKKSVKDHGSCGN